MYFIAEEVWVLFDLKIILSIVNLLLSFYFTFYFFGGEGTIIFKFQFYKKKKVLLPITFQAPSGLCDSEKSDSCPQNTSLLVREGRQQRSDKVNNVTVRLVKVL